eukprot:3962077-Prymnesium_polylepis.1
MVSSASARRGSSGGAPSSEKETTDCMSAARRSQARGDGRRMGQRQRKSQAEDARCQPRVGHAQQRGVPPRGNGNVLRTRASAVSMADGR